MKISIEIENKDRVGFRGLIFEADPESTLVVLKEAGSEPIQVGAYSFGDLISSLILIHERTIGV